MKLQKTISIVTSLATTLSLSGVMMLAPMAALAVDVVDGDLIRNPSAEGLASLDIYIVKVVGTEKFKRLILSPHVFESYAHFDKNGNGNNWDDVMDVDQATMDAYTTTDLVRVDGTDEVYRLYAADGTDTGDKYWLNMTAAEFTAVFNANAIYTINSTDSAGYTAGSNVTDASATFPPAGGSVVSTGTLSVTLAADTPAAGIAVSGAARVPFTKINLTATGGDVIVDSMTIQRSGSIAQDGAFSSVAVVLDNVDGDQLGNNKTLNSTHETALNDDLTISNGTTKSILLVGNMAASLTSYAGEIPTLTLKAITLKGDAVTSASLPLTGNSMTINSTVTIGTVVIAAGGNNPSASTQNVGITDYTVSAIKATAGAAEAVTIKKIVFTQDGSAGASDVENVDLVNANTGAVLATIAKPSGKTLTFDSGITIAKGKNNSFDLRLDIIDGSGRTISYDIDENTDMLIKGDTYGYYITPTYPNTSRPYYNAPDTTVGNGSLRVESVAVSPTTIAEDKSGVTLGKFKFVAKGEEVKLTSVGWKFKIATSTAGAEISDITNVTVYDESGSAIAGPMDPTQDFYTNAAANVQGTATSTDTVIIPVGETTYTVKGDLSADFASNDTVQAILLPSTFTSRGMITDNTITPTPASNISATALTVKAAALTITVASTPAAQTVVAGKQDHVFANYVFDASDSGTDVKVTQVKIPVITTTASFPDMVTGFELFDGTTKIGVDTDTVAYSTAGSTVGGSSTTTMGLTSGALVIPAGTSKTITVKGDIGTGATSGSVRVGIQSDGVTATDDTGTQLTETITAAMGQVMTVVSGGLLNLSAMSDPAAALAVSGSSDVSVAKFSLQAKYEDITLNYLGIKLAAPANGIDATNEYDQVASVALYEDGVATAIGTIPTNAVNATITPSSTLTIPAGTTKSFTLKATFAALNDTSPAGSGSGLKFAITNLDATGASAGSTSITKSGLDATFNQFNIFKSVPTVTQIAFTGSDTITGNTDVKLIKFKVSADSAGPVGLYKFTFGISTTTVYLSNTNTDVGDTTGYYLYMSDSESSLGNIVSRGAATAGGWKSDMNGANVGSGGNETLLETYFDVNDDASATGTEQIIINAGATKYFTLKGTIVSGYVIETTSSCSITTKMAGDASFSHTALLSADGLDDAYDQDDFIWSDLNADLYSSTTATRTAMFVGGYRVYGLDSTTSTGQTISN